MGSDVQDLQERLVQGGVSHRQFLKFCGAMVATLALPKRYVTEVAAALTTAIRPPLVWLEFQDCAGDTESFLRARQPSVDELLLETISLDYHETIMVPAGMQAERSLADTVQNYPGQYICIVEGSIPTKEQYRLRSAARWLRAGKSFRSGWKYQGRELNGSVKM